MPVPLLFLFQGLGHRVEILIALGERLAFGRDVAIVKAIERGAQLFHELEGDAHAVHRVLDVVVSRFPGALHRAGAERIAAGSAEGMPIGNGEAQMVLHRLAFDHFGGVVVPEGEHVLGLGALEADLGDFWKCRHRYPP